MKRRAASVATVLGATALSTMMIGCGDEALPAASFDSEGWIDTSPAGPPGARPGAGDGREDDEGDEGDGEGGIEGFWGLFGRYADGQLSELGGEFFAEDETRELCLLLFDAMVRGDASGCTECTAAWEIELGSPEAEIDVGGACAAYGPAQIEGLVLRLGITADNDLMRDDGEGWRPIGEVEFEGGEVVLEWEEGSQPLDPDDE